MKKIAIIIFSGLILFSSITVFGEDGKATPEDVYQLVLKAHEVLSNLGDDGLAAFNDPKGEFVFKDTYVFVVKCPDTMAAHPFAMEKLKGKDLRKMTPGLTDSICLGSKNLNGTWVEYTWPKPGEEKRKRKISFVISVKGTPYIVVAGIYDDKISIEELNKTMLK
jgi:hypothetical protein